MIFHTVHCHSVVDSLSLKSGRVPAARFPWQQEQIVKVWADLEQTVVDEAIDQWTKRLKACIKAKGQHFEHLL